MGMRKKWSRTIIVDGVRYRYHVAEDHFDGLALHVCVQRVEPAGQRLMSWFQKPMAWTEVETGLVGRVMPHAITPRVIRQLILAALGQGWRPSAMRLGAFHLPGSKVVATLPVPPAPAM